MVLLGDSTTYFLPAIANVIAVLDKLYDKSIEAYASLESPINHSNPEDLFVRGQDFETAIANRTSVHFGVKKSQSHIAFDCQPQRSFNRNFGQVIKHLIDNESQGFRNHLFCSSQQQADRFVRIAEELSSKKLFEIHIMPPSIRGLSTIKIMSLVIQITNFLNVITNSDLKMAMQKTSN